MLRLKTLVWRSFIFIGGVPIISASSAWVAAHRELLLPEMFIEIAYTVSEPGLQEDAVATGVEQEAFSETAEVVSSVESEPLIEVFKFKFVELYLLIISGI